MPLLGWIQARALPHTLHVLTPCPRLRLRRRPLLLLVLLQELRAALKKQGADCFDLVFIDHEKSVYLSDLQLLVKEGLIK